MLFRSPLVPSSESSVCRRPAFAIPSVPYTQNLGRVCSLAPTRSLQLIGSPLAVRCTTRAYYNLKARASNDPLSSPIVARDPKSRPQASDVRRRVVVMSAGQGGAVRSHEERRNTQESSPLRTPSMAASDSGSALITWWSAIRRPPRLLGWTRPTLLPLAPAFSSLARSPTLL